MRSHSILPSSAALLKLRTGPYRSSAAPRAVRGETPDFDSPQNRLAPTPPLPADPDEFPQTPMSSFTYNFGGSLTAKPTPLQSLLPPAAAPLAVALVTLVSTAWRNPLYTLFTSALTWAIIFGTCARLSPRSGRFSSGLHTKRKPAILAGCILVAALCDRASGASTSMAWAKVGSPYLVGGREGGGQENC